jgi:hypothetical protein
MEGLIQLQTMQYGSTTTPTTMLLGLDKKGRVWRGRLTRTGEGRESAGFTLRWFLMDEEGRD